MTQCLICDNPVRSDGQVAIRILQGTLEYRRWGLHLKQFEFEDDDTEKWVHVRCAKKVRIVVAMLKHRHCILCGSTMELDGDGYFGDCVLRIERGIKPPEPSAPSERPDAFEAKHGGYVHFSCAIEKWRLDLCSQGI